MSDQRALEAARRLGAPVEECEVCHRLTLAKLNWVGDWAARALGSNEEIPMYFACSDCVRKYTARNKEHARRSAEESFQEARRKAAEVARIREPSSAGYRAACASMRDEVDDILGPGWDRW